MPTFSFSTKATNRVTSIIREKTKEKLNNIVNSPFPIDPEYVDKTITLSLNDTKREETFTSTSKKVKLGNYCVVMQDLAKVAPLWLSKSPYAMYLITYIIGNLKLYSNQIEITYKDFCLYANCSQDSFTRALKAVMRPNVNYTCAGDNFALLAPTNRKSIYVVNHNFIFRGNYDEFVTLYELKFPNGCKLDSKGRVIIDR